MQISNKTFNFTFILEFCWHKWKIISGKDDPDLVELCIKCGNVIDVGNRQFYGGKWRIKKHV